MELAKKNKRFNPSWFLVIIMLSAFWPVGLYFLWSKLQNLSAPTPDKPRGHGMRTGGVAMALAAVFLRATGGITFLWMLFWLLGAATLIGFDRYQQRRDQQFGRYRAIIGDNNTMSIMSIASAMGVSYDTACKDLQSMIDEQYFPKHAYIDLGAGLYIAHSQYAPKGAASTLKPDAKAVPPKRAAQAAPFAPASNAPTEEENEYVRWLTQIRKANDVIKDEKLSAQIDQIEQYTANIFECVVERPEKKREINTFMNYYLPTTLKLLNAYGRLEKQNVSGGNIEASKKNIEAMVDQLVWAFRRQNDQMFQKEALDISSDIKVMETMLAKDGLSDGGLPRSPFAAAVQKKSI